MVRETRASQRQRVRTYLLVRAGGLSVFMLSVLLLPRMWAAAGCVLAAVIGGLGCVGANAGGPGERAGAAAREQEWERVRAPQGEWPPYPEERVIEGEVIARGAVPKQTRWWPEW